MIDRVRVTMLSLVLTFAGVLVIVTPARASEATARQLLESAAQAMEAGEYDKAIELYSQSRDLLPGLAGIPYNMAVAEHRLGRYDEAAKLFEDARTLARDPSLRAKAAYNLGSSAYNQSLQSLGVGRDSAEQQPEQADLEGALDRLGEALDYYRNALAADPSDDDARRNAESAHRLRRMIEQLQQKQQSGENEQSDQQQQDQEQQQQQPQQQPQDEKPSDQQQEQQDASAQQNQDQPPPSESEQEAQRQPQQGQEDQTPPMPDAADPQQGRQQGTQHPQPTESESSQDQQEDQQAGSASANEHESQDDQPAEDARTDRAAGEPDDDAPLSKEQVDRLLQRIRDMARERREALAEQQRARYRPAEKDW